MCFLRHRHGNEAFDTLNQALEFRKVIEKAKKEGFLTAAHAGEENKTKSDFGDGKILFRCLRIFFCFMNCFIRVLRWGIDRI